MDTVHLHELYEKLMQAPQAQVNAVVRELTQEVSTYDTIEQIEQALLLLREPMRLGKIKSDVFFSNDWQNIIHDYIVLCGGREAMRERLSSKI